MSSSEEFSSFGSALGVIRLLGRVKKHPLVFWDVQLLACLILPKIHFPYPPSPNL
jgi:hypothetical protein